MREQALGRLAVRLAAEDAAAIGRADDHRHRPFAGRAIAHLRHFADNLVVPGVDIVGELDLYDGLDAVSRHSDSRRDDAAFADRRIEGAGLAELLLETL